MLTKDLFAGTLQAILVFSFLNALFDADVVLNCSLSHSLSTVLISAGPESIFLLVPLTALERDRGLLRLKTGLLRCHSFSQSHLSLMEELCPCRCSSRMSRAVLPGRSERQQKAFRSEPSRALTAVSFFSWRPWVVSHGALAGYGDLRLSDGHPVRTASVCLEMTVYVGSRGVLELGHRVVG